MPSITLTDPTTGTTVASGLVATNNANLRALLNGGLDYANLKGTPALQPGEVAVWDGTQFARSSVTRVGVTSLGSGTPDATKFLRGDGAWVAPAATYPAPNYGTSLPGSPTDGLEAILVDSLTNPTYFWRFRYNSGSLFTDKWEFIGGSSLIALQSAATTVTNTVYADPASLCSLTVPRGGVYEVDYGAQLKDAGTGITSHFSLKKGASATADADSLNVLASANVTNLAGIRLQTITLAASDVLKLQGKASSGTLNIAAQFIRVKPIRVS